MTRTAGPAAILLLAAACASSPADRETEPPPTVLHDVTLIDATGAPALPGRAITIAGDRIVAIGPADRSAYPAGARVIDATGRWAIPGLWDLHVHLTKTGEAALPVLLGNGVTSVRDMGGDLELVRSMERRIAAGEIDGPRIWTPGPMLERPETLERIARQATREPSERTRVPVPDTASARRVVDSLAALGVDFVKIREAASHEVYAAIVRAARARGLRVAGHAPFGLDEVEGARLGVASFEHASYPYPLDTLPARRREILDAFADSGVALVPTLTAWRTHLMHPDSLAIVVHDSAGRRDPRRRLLSDDLVWEWAGDLEDLEPKGADELAGWRRFLDRTAVDLKALHDVGVPVLPGSDLAGIGLFPGWSLHEEIEALVEAVGLTPLEAIVAATRRAAELLGAEDELGTLEAGKRADLLLLSANPLADVRNTRRIEAVVKGGRLYGPDELRRLLGGLTPSTEGDIELSPGRVGRLRRESDG
ncbi:MAG: amidohydrolase family protein [Gemmatimonadota bacterium]|nr:amidohydrolase family protein [Gemmatimonadota bacterium]